jgi:hypothetical protein
VSELVVIKAITGSSCGAGLASQQAEQRGCASILLSALNNTPTALPAHNSSDGTPVRLTWTTLEQGMLLGSDPLTSSPGEVTVAPFVRCEICAEPPDHVLIVIREAGEADAYVYVYLYVNVVDKFIQLTPSIYMHTCNCTCVQASLKDASFTHMCARARQLVPACLCVKLSACALSWCHHPQRLHLFHLVLLHRHGALQDIFACTEHRSISDKGGQAPGAAARMQPHG